LVCGTGDVKDCIAQVVDSVVVRKKGVLAQKEECGNHQNNRFVTIATIHSYKDGSLAEPEKAIEITQLQPLQFHRIQSAVLPTINTFS